MDLTSRAFVRLRARVLGAGAPVQAMRIGFRARARERYLGFGGDGGRTVGLRERRDRLVLLAFPRGDSHARFGAGGRLSSRESRDRWTLRVRARRTRTLGLEASLSTLPRPFTPRSVTLDGRELRRGAWRWSARRQVLE